jgi:transcriptional regulator with XRE-family HTH domain
MVSEDAISCALRWDWVDRLNKSLRVSGLKVQEMADFLECSRNTVGNWLNDRATPSPASLQLWAQKTGVPYGWLRDGKLPGEVTNDYQADLPAPERLRLMGAALLQMADQLSKDMSDG